MLESIAVLGVVYEYKYLDRANLCVKLAILVGPEQVFPDFRQHLNGGLVYRASSAQSTHPILQQPQSLIESVIQSDTLGSTDELNPASTII